MSWASDYFGEEIVTKNGTVKTSDALAGKKRVAVYFSAHWCPPCRQFTPLLADFYKRAKEVDADGLEVVFVSADSDDDSFNEYYGEMPWTSVIFGADECEDLNSKFGVNGIPTLIILDGASGKVKDKEARGTVSSSRGDVAACFAKW